MLTTHAVGIDLGTTYSCIAYLNEHGEPVSIPNKDGELSTPSAVLFDGDQVIVGTEALRNSILHADRVVVHAKRQMGNPTHRWKIDGKSYSPIDISAYILKSMLDTAREQIGPVTSAVITVPAQFSEIQRQATVEAGKRAGLTHIDIINEPVAAALCYVLGTEGIWFSELAEAQTVLVVDLGGGTFDLSLVKYQKNEVRVLASGGDLHLGGLDWNKALENEIRKLFFKEFGIDLTKDRESAQALALEAEQTKRSLSVRPKAALTVVSGGQRKTYQVELERFERLTNDFVVRMEQLTLGLLKQCQMGWAKVDVVLTTGGSSRMPMVRNMLKRLSGRTLNTSLSPDQSIAHGATYYAGMLLTNNEFAKSILTPAAANRLSQYKQQSTSARALGILIRNVETGARIPHYILPAHTQLPAAVSQIYGTVSAGQPRIHLRVVESGTAADSAHVELGTCRIESLPANLPAGSEIEVTITYDEQARVYVAAKLLATGQVAHTEFVRPENRITSPLNAPVEQADSDSVHVVSPSAPRVTPDIVAKGDLPSRSINRPNPVATPKPAPKPASAPLPSGLSLSALEDSSVPIPLCNDCGEPLNARGQCFRCESRPRVGKEENGAAKPKPSAPMTATKRTVPNEEMTDFPWDDADSGKLPQEKSTQGKPASPAKPAIKPPPIPPAASQGSSNHKSATGSSKPAVSDDDLFWKSIGDL